MELTGQHVFITGGGSGIGLALATALLQRGNRVTVCGRNPEKLLRAAQENPGLETLQVDLSREEGLQQIRTELDGALKSVSILVNNAAVGRAYSLLLDADAACDLEAELATNLMVPIRLTQMFLPVLMARDRAAVVNMTSGFAVWPSAVVPGYSVAKGGLTAFSRILRNQLRETGVKVFEVQPPLVETDLVKEASARKMPPEKVAAIALAGIQRDHFEIRIGVVRLMPFCAGVVPWFLDWVLRRYPFKLKDLPRLYAPPGKNQR